MNFKNYTKILNNDVHNLKNDYNSEMQLYLKRKVLLTKKINLIRTDDLKNSIVQNKNILKFNRDVLNDFTLIKVTYDKSK